MRVQTLAYILWRAIATGYLSLRETSDLYGVFAREIARVSREIDHILRSIDRPQHRKRCAFLEKDGDYSRAGVIDPNRIQHLSQSLQIHPARALRKLLRNTQLNPGIHVSLVEDSLKFLQELSNDVDVIFTDPPYGFNAEECGHQELCELYSQLIPACLGALRSGGHLMLVLPAFARTGRQVPFFETAESIIRQVLANTCSADKRCKRIVETFPEPKQLFTYPPYWSSADVLERKIVHFVIE